MSTVADSQRAFHQSKAALCALCAQAQQAAESRDTFQLRSVAYMMAVPAHSMGIPVPLAFSERNECGADELLITIRTPFGREYRTTISRIASQNENDPPTEQIPVEDANETHEYVGRFMHDWVVFLPAANGPEAIAGTPEHLEANAKIAFPQLFRERTGTGLATVKSEPGNKTAQSVDYISSSMAVKLFKKRFENLCTTKRLSDGAARNRLRNAAERGIISAKGFAKTRQYRLDQTARFIDDQANAAAREEDREIERQRAKAD